MSVVLYVHPAHVAAIGAYQVTQYWLDRGHSTRVTPSLRHLTLEPVSDQTLAQYVVRLHPPKLQRFPR